jgi:hypothetical protein
LLDQLVQQVPSQLHRAALEASSLVRLLTESLLSALLKQDDVHELFHWLRDLSFMEIDRRGIFPHDLTREALTADVRWRNPDWFAELHHRARGYYMAHIKTATSQEQRQILSDLVYLHRENPSVKPFFLWQESGTVFTDAFRPDDAEELAEMVERHEGPESAALAIHWFSRQPENVSVLRGPSGQPVGFLARVSLEATSAADRRLDPAVEAAWQVLNRNPLRSGETAILFRFWMARDAYQSVSPEQTRLVLNIIQDYLITPGLAFTFVPLADPEFWRMAFEYTDIERLPEADFTVGNRRYGVFGHDWRIRPPLAWFEMLAERELNMTPPTRRPRFGADSLIVLSEADFATAVREALRDYTNPSSLGDNPLTRSRLVSGRVGKEASRAERAAALHKVIQETAESLKESPRLAKFHRAIYHTYFQPAITQEQAAEVLDLPFSTYRRHLRSGIEEMTARLWAREIGNLEG